MGNEAIAYFRDLPYNGQEKIYILKSLKKGLRPPFEPDGNRLAVLGDTGGGKSKTIISVVELDLGTAVRLYDHDQ